MYVGVGLDMWMSLVCEVHVYVICSVNICIFSLICVLYDCNVTRHLIGSYEFRRDTVKLILTDRICLNIRIDRSWI